MKLLALILAILVLSVSGAHAQWSWAYPKPQGHTLYDVVFLDNTTAIAVGEYGTIMVTHDTGTNWSVQAKVQSVTTDLSRIDKLDANTAVVVGKNGIILRTIDQGVTWALAPASSSNDLLDVSFGDATHGVIAAGNAVLRTSDGGLTWIPIPSPSGNMVSVDMISGTEAVSLTPLYRSIDGGATWSAMTMPAGVTTGSVVEFLDSLHGAFVVAGFSGAASSPHGYSTADGGATWISATLNHGATNEDVTPYELIYPVSNQLEFIGTRLFPQGASPPRLASVGGRSENGGESWSSTGSQWPSYGIDQNSNGIVLLVGWGGKILRRTSIATFEMGGAFQDPRTFDASGVAFANPQNGIVFSSDGEHVVSPSGNTFFAYTTNGGTTWGRSFASGTQCVDATCLSSTEFIAVGMDVSAAKGNIVRSTNSGATWSLIWSQAVPSRLRAVCATSPTSALVVGNSGTALLIDNGVVTSVSTGGSDFSDVAFGALSIALAVGATDVRSMDGGHTWTPTLYQDTVFAIANATRSPSFPTFAGISPTGIFSTRNMGPGVVVGDFWAPEKFVTGLTDIAIDPSASYGVAVGSTVLESQSGLWKPIDPPTLHPLKRVTVPASGISFISGEQAITFRHQQQAPLPTLIRTVTVSAHAFGAELRWDVVPDNNLVGFSVARRSGIMRETIASNLAVTSRSFRDEGLIPGSTYEYQVLAIDRDGSFTQSMPVTVTIPKATIELLPNQPNPFNPETTIRFVIPEQMRVTISVHDVAGRMVAILLDDVCEPGIHDIRWNAQGVASGVYFARLHVDKSDVTRKMVLLK